MHTEQVLQFLKKRFPTISTVQFIGAGMFSQAFSFSTNQGDFIIRINQDDEDFRKDDYAHRHYASAALPVPKMVNIGQFSDSHYYAITQKCPGRTHNEMSITAANKILPGLFQTLHAIHSIDVSSRKKWGLLDTQGQGLFESWEAYLLSFYNQKFAFTWDFLYAETFLQRDVVEYLQQKIVDLLPYCAGKKHLVHGDFGFDNLVVSGKTITGVLDWAEAKYGDFLYDVAYLDFWSKDIRYGHRLKAWYRRQGHYVPHFEERIACYMLHIGLGSMAIDAITNNERGYIRTRERTLSVLKPGRRLPTDWTQ